jgi:hypothetical protein
MATITDSTATEPAFVVERFAVAGDRVEVAGHWRDVRGRRFMRPVLWLHRGESRRRLVAVLDHKPWAADDGEPWLAAFKWEGGKLDVDRAELEVGRELVVELPLPGGRAQKPRPAKPRVPSELDRVREQLLSATKERSALQAALDEATVQADDVSRLRAERDVAREEAERARADGERLVNDEYRQRERALEAAEAAGAKAREAATARSLAERQLTAAREAHAKLEQRLAALEPELRAVGEERDRLRAELAEAGDRIDRLRGVLKSRPDATEVVAERDRLRAELAESGDRIERLRAELAARPDEAEIERLRAELAARPEDAGIAAERDRLAGDLAGVLADRDQLAADVTAARAGRERVEAELVAARADRKRLERELDTLRAENERERRRPARRRLRTTSDSRLAPPRSGNALWAVRAVAVGLVAILAAAIVLLVSGVV